ncbi:MAG TPA: adenylate/guanylate cyclase domain-containing protein [Stellaceae bacterium]|jgi:adenylate cyclase|nr:adenylate/guanylate cyclase domain-containing protein [Stellaceae bacterium]
MNFRRGASVARHLAAILAADVAGYARLMSEDEEGTLAGLRAWRHQVADPRIRARHGRIIKSTGDGFLVEFASVVDAVRCAVEMQRDMAARNGELPAERRIEFRIGINLGDIVAEDHDIFGDGVNVAARLEALAEPAGVCVSRVVRDQIRDKLPYVFEDRGEQQVKNIARPVRVYALSPAAIAATELAAAPQHRRVRLGLRLGIVAAIVVVAAAGGFAIWRVSHEHSPVAAAAPITAAAPSVAAAVASVPRLSIIVLPFENLSHDPDQDYFADAITEDLTTDLSRIAGSFVIARNTAFTYKGIAVDVRQLGRDLGVHYALAGSVRHIGDQVQVDVQLIDATTGAQVWADRFETDRRNLASAQSDITGRLARTLNLELVQAVGRQIENERDPDAQDLIMRGWALYQNTQAATSRETAKKEFEQALKIDPASYEAKLGIAAVLVVDLANGTSEQPAADEAEAEKLLAELRARNANRAQLHDTAALLRRYQNRLPESRVEWERAIELDPNDAIAYGQLGVTLIYLGDPAAAIPLEEKRIHLNPDDPNIALAYWSLGLAHLLQGQQKDAIDWLTKARVANPRIYYVYLDLAAAQALNGDLEGAKAALAESLKLKPEINSMVRQRQRWAYSNNPAYRALAEKTVDVGLRLAGMPED